MQIIITRAPPDEPPETRSAPEDDDKPKKPKKPDLKVIDGDGDDAA